MLFVNVATAVCLFNVIIIISWKLMKNSDSPSIIVFTFAGVGDRGEYRVP